MEREISIATELAITLVSLAALISVIIGITYMGNSLKEEMTGSFTDIKVGMYDDYVNALAKSDTDNEMPTVTAYNILTTYEKVIIKSANGMTGEVRLLLTEGSDLKDDLKGRVQLQIVKTNVGGYVAFIHESYCTWKIGTCTCFDKTGFNALKSEYGITTGW